MTTTAIPSTLPEDFSINVGNVDKFVTSPELTFTDRMGVERKTIAGVVDELGAQAAITETGQNRIAAQAAQAAAETAADEALMAAGTVTYLTYAAMTADTSQDANTLGRVLTDPDPAKNLYYVWTGSAWAISGMQIADAATLAAVTDILQVDAGGGAEPVLFGADDEESGEALLVTAQRLRTPAVEMEATDESGLVDGEGGILIHQTADRVIVGPLDVGHTMRDGVYVTDEEGAIFQELSAAPDDEGVFYGPLEAGAYFAEKIVTAHGIPVRAHIASMLSRREDAPTVVATIASASTAATASSSTALDLSPEVYGSAATLSLRDEGAGLRQSMPLQLLQIPNPPPSATPIKILLIADSIGNYEGAKLLSEYLTAWGYAPSFVGTVNGSANDTSSNAGGPLGECRPGWETGDFTYSLTDEATPVAVGDEAAYLALSKTTKITRNPFIRLATGGDAPEIVRNGYVLDFEFYRTRFSLSMPDVVIYALGTNDARDRASDSIYGDVYANDMLLLSRLRAAWPDAKILRTLPGAGVTAHRNELWTSKYTKIIRAMRDAAVALADPLLTIVPTWAFTNPDGGYSAPSGLADATTGFTAGDFEDAIHPIGASRKALYQALSPYVAAAALDII